MSQAELEVCVDTAAALTGCLQAGVDRIELCSALALGGLTPTYGLMRLAGRLARTVQEGDSGRSCSAEEREAVESALDTPQLMAMIRPRAGDFCFSKVETDCMCDDIMAVRDAGLDGVVLGAASANGVLDLPVLRRLCRTAEGLQLTLHRVIDLLDDPLLAIDQAIDLGFARILTSGGAVDVAAGLLQLSEMRKHADNRIQIMAGAGLSPSLARLIRSQIGIESFHASCRRSVASNPDLSAFGFGGEEYELDRSLVADFQRSLGIDPHY